MKKTILIAAAIISTMVAEAQNKYFTRDGKINFSASTPLENIEAQNSKATAVLDGTTGQIEFSLLMKAFVFEKALMQEHFNENYVESTKYPKSVFKGQIENMAEVKFDKDGSYPVKLRGQLTLHGVTKDVTTKGTVVIKNGKIQAKMVFNILIEEYDIEIPSLVKDKVAKDVKISVDVNLEPLAKS